MSLRTLPGLGFRSLPDWSAQHSQHVILQNNLRRVLAFTGDSIDDVVNNPISKNRVLGYYKLQKTVQRGCEIVDLERWWNGKS